jgi:hypothetical protein
MYSLPRISKYFLDTCACYVGSVSIVPDSGSLLAWRPARSCALNS